MIALINAAHGYVFNRLASKYLESLCQANNIVLYINQSYIDNGLAK